MQTDKGTLVINHLADFDKVSLHVKGGHTEPIGIAGHAGHANMVHQIEAFLSMVREGRVEDSILTWDLAREVARVMDKARDDAGIVFPADEARI